jgi:hypothetical protein
MQILTHDFVRESRWEESALLWFLYLLSGCLATKDGDTLSSRHVRIVCPRPKERYAGINIALFSKKAVGARGGVVAKALRSKPAGRGFKQRVTASNGTMSTVHQTLHDRSAAVQHTAAALEHRRLKSETSKYTHEQCNKATWKDQ